RRGARRAQAAPRRPPHDPRRALARRPTVRAAPGAAARARRAARRRRRGLHRGGGPLLAHLSGRPTVRHHPVHPGHRPGHRGVWPGWGFGGRQAAGVIRDWAATSRSGRYPRLGGVDVDAALAGVDTPVLAIDVEGDDLTPAGTMDYFAGKLGAATRAHYSTAD